MKKLDIFIIKNFLSTFLFVLILFLSIVIIFDISEKIDDFLDKDVSFELIIFDYYVNFIPYFTNMLSPLIIFISVIFFTSKMASNTEFIAIMSGGVSYNRILVPYIFCAALLCGCSFYLSGYIIPPANKIRIAFENKYIRAPRHTYTQSIHKRIDANTYVYFGSYNQQNNTGSNFSIENFDGQELLSKTTAEFVKWDTTLQNWSLKNWVTRELKNDHEILTHGESKDTTIENVHPAEFTRRLSYKQLMTNTELEEYINLETEKGSTNLGFYKVEQHKRGAFPFSTIILTLIGVSLASRKSRGGIGLHIGIGLIISFSYIFLMQVSTTFAIYGNFSPLIAVWIPNILFLILGLGLYTKAQK